MKKWGLEGLDCGFERLALIIPDLMTDVLGLGDLAPVFASQRWSQKPGRPGRNPGLSGRCPVGAITGEDIYAHDPVLY
jgi:hypothetical protein